MRLVALSLFISLVASLGGCLATGGGINGTSSTQPAVVYQPEPGLTARERLRKAIGLLEVGEAGQAKVELETYLVEEPNGKLAKKLLNQINADPQKVFGSDSFRYKMQPGDSLSTVSKRMLGDPMQFHLLARYNGIENPRAMKAGQIIKVPGKRPAGLEQTVELESEPATAEVEPAENAGAAEEVTEPSDDAAPAESEKAEAEEPVNGGQGAEDAAPSETQTANLAEPEAAEPTAMESEVDEIQSLIIEAQKLSSEGEYKQAAGYLEQGLERFPDADLIKSFAAANYLSFADQLDSEGRVDDAFTVLERSAQLDPGNKEVKLRLAANYLAQSDRYAGEGKVDDALAALKQAEKLDPGNAGIKGRRTELARLSEAELEFAKGTKHLNAGENILAYEAFNAALKIAPDHVGAQKQLAGLAPVVANGYHREAMTAFRRQDLDRALGIWEKVLEIDPAHGPAQIYRAQALDLKQKLNTIPAEQQQ